MDSHQNTELISVIIPAFNSGDSIGYAIQSVIDQHYEPIEIIVIDDGSTDQTADSVKIFGDKVRYFRQENKGVAAARNKGLEISTGTMITFVDADDIWTENKLKMQLRIFRENPDTDIVMGMLTLTESDKTKPSETKINKDDIGTFAVQLGTMLIKKSVFDTIGLFDEEMVMSEDIDFMNRVREAGMHIFVHKEIVQRYRLHDRNMTGDKTMAQRYMLKAYKKSLERRRIAGSASIAPLKKLDNFEEVLEFWKPRHHQKNEKKTYK